MRFIKNYLPKRVVSKISFIKAKNRRSNIINTSSKLKHKSDVITFVLVVGSTYDETRPDAMLVARQAYCNAFEQMNISYKVIDIRDIYKELPKIHNPFCMLYSNDLDCLDKKALNLLNKTPLAVWVHPWFDDSDAFFLEKDLDPSLWNTPKKTLDYILSLNPKFVFSATLDSGRKFFSKWEQNSIRFVSIPLACDSTRYNQLVKSKTIFKDTELAFVGGYWASKGVQIDRYLKQVENKLTVYGYNKWPYANFGGLISSDDEPSLYASAKICPVINEPTVSLMHGQINERVFKVLGSGGMPIVDNIPQYRQLFSEDELVISSDPDDFLEKVNFFLSNPDARKKYIQSGRKAVFSRHTYIHRAKFFLKNLNIDWE